MRLQTFTLFSHLLHIMFIWFLHLWARDPDPGSQSHVVSYSRSYFFTFFSYSVKTSFSSSSIRIVFTTLVFAIHFPGMKNKRGGLIFHSMENTQFCFFRLRDGLKCLMCHGPVIAPTSFVLQKYIGGSASHGAAKHIPQGFGGCRVFATHFPRMNDRGGSPIFHFIEMVGLASCTAVRHTPQGGVAGLGIFH